MQTASENNRPASLSLMGMDILASLGKHCMRVCLCLIYAPDNEQGRFDLAPSLVANLCATLRIKEKILRQCVAVLVENSLIFHLEGDKYALNPAYFWLCEMEDLESVRQSISRQKAYYRRKKEPKTN